MSKVTEAQEDSFQLEHEGAAALCFPMNTAKRLLRDLEVYKTRSLQLDLVNQKLNLRTVQNIKLQKSFDDLMKETAEQRESFKLVSGKAVQFQQENASIRTKLRRRTLWLVSLSLTTLTGVITTVAVLKN